MDISIMRDPRDPMQEKPNHPVEATVLFFVLSSRQTAEAYLQCKYTDSESLNPSSLHSIHSSVATNTPVFSRSSMPNLFPFDAHSYCHSPDPQHSGMERSSSTQVSEVQPTSHMVQVTGMYVYDPSLISTK
jgi:hypothetical protein